MSLTEIQLEIIKGHVCPYCKAKSVLINSIEVYGKDYGMMWRCKPCDAYVGCHKGTNDALGRLANKELRVLKMEAHKYFDLIWKNKNLTRSDAYKWLSEKLSIEPEYTHIGMFSEKTLKDVIYFSKQVLNDIRRNDLDFGDEPKTPFYEI